MAKSPSKSAPLVVNGWTLYVHPLFLFQLEKLIAAVTRDKEKDAKGFHLKPNAKLLAAIQEITLRRIPQNPADQRYRQGDTLGDDLKHWFRDKFGNGRFRLFFRFDTRAKIIIYAWVNDNESLRERGAKTDAYEVFKKLLGTGNPPNDWDALLNSCKHTELVDKFQGLVEGSAAASG
jgi:toxin YhaV